MCLSKRKEPLVSVIIPVYNVEKYLERCITSVLNQKSNFPYEIILVDDGSTDSSGRICDSYHKSCVIIHKKNEGVSSARNEGIKRAKGKYVYFCDSDDYIEEDTLSYLVDLIETPTCVLAICGFYVNEELRDYGLKGNIDVLSTKKGAKTISGNPYFTGGYLWNKLFKKDIIEKNSLLFDERFAIYEDLLFVHTYIATCDDNASIRVGGLGKYHYCLRPFSAMTSKRLTDKKLSSHIAYKEVCTVCEKYRDVELNEALSHNYTLSLSKLLVLYNSEDEKEFSNQCDKIFEEYRKNLANYIFKSKKGSLHQKWCLTWFN